MEKNDAWVQGIIDEGRDVYMASPTRDNLTDELGDPTVFSRELDQLRAAGYVEEGDYLRAPRRI
jgi:hypothetical protein